MRRHHCGLTLIELLVALAIFAVLGTMTYRATAHMTGSSHIIEQDLERWREISRALHIIETELLQIVAPATAAGSQRQPPLRGSNALGSREGGSQIDFLSLANPETVERVSFRHFAGRLEWRRWPDLQPGGNILSDTLLDNVGEVRWRFLINRIWQENWPPSGDYYQGLPAAIELELTLPDIGTLRRLYALR